MGDSNNSHSHPLQRKRPSWVPTVIAQVLLCLALYATLAIWTPRVQISNTSYGGTRKRVFSYGSIARSTDLYFLSVSGGSRPVPQQTQLLQQMALAAKIFNVKFVVGLSELGKSDPLFLNATRYYPSLNISWYNYAPVSSIPNYDISFGTEFNSVGLSLYTAKDGKMDEKGYFLRRVTLSHGQTLDIIHLDMALVQDTIQKDGRSLSDTTQIDWLTRMQAESNSIWCIVVGYHPLIDCTKMPDGTQSLEPSDHLHSVFLKHRVNVYLSKLGCAGHFSRHSGVTYIGIPSYPDEYFSRQLKNSSTRREIHGAFLLHRVSPLEIESYFINSMGEVVSRYTLPQWGREVM